MCCHLLSVSVWPAHHRSHESLAQDEALTALRKLLYLLNGILDGQVVLPGRAWDGCGRRRAMCAGHRDMLPWAGISLRIAQRNAFFFLVSGLNS